MTSSLRMTLVKPVTWLVGASPSTSTEDSCSTYCKIALNSPLNSSTSASLKEIRAKRASFKTSSRESVAIPYIISQKISLVSILQTNHKVYTALNLIDAIVIDVTILETSRNGDVVDSHFRVEGSHGSFLVHESVNHALTGLAPDLICFQGIVQATGDRWASTVHTNAQQDLPVASVTTVGNNGVGIHNGQDTASRAETAADRIAYLRERSAKAGLILAGLSLGSQTAHDIVKVDTIGDLPIRGVAHIGPGLASTARARELTQRLPNHVGMSTLWSMGQAFFTDQPKFWNNSREIANILTRSALNMQPIDHQRSMIERGTNPEEIERVSLRYPTIVIAGLDDVVYDRFMWQAIRSRTGLAIHEVKGVGHNLVYEERHAIRALKHAFEYLSPASAHTPAA